MRPRRELVKSQSTVFPLIVIGIAVFGGKVWDMPAWRMIPLTHCVWPMSAHRGLCDHWLAWNVYSSRIERVGVTLTEEGVRRLPEPARRLVVDGELWLDRWSLVALDVPIYPQLRFQFGVVESLRRRCGAENLVEVSVQHSQSEGGFLERLTVEDFDERRHLFWINAQPRDGLPAGNRR